MQNMSQITIVFLILIGMTLSFFTGFLPISITALCVPLLLQLTGVLDASEAWAAFSNTTIITYIPLFVLGAVLKKSSFTARMRLFIGRFSKSRGGKIKMLLFAVLSTALVTTFMNPTAAVTIMIPMLIAVADDAGIPRKSMLKTCADASISSGCVIPVGVALARYAYYNNFLEAGGATERFSMMDPILVSSPMFFAFVIFMVLVGYKCYYPKEGCDTVLDAMESTVDVAKATTYTPKQDKLAIGMFFGSVVAMVITTNFTDIPMYIVGGCFAIACIALKLINEKEAINSMAWTTILLLVGTLPLSTAITKTGANLLIADFVSKLVGGSTNMYVVAAIFYLVPFVLTQFLSNAAVGAVFRPLSVAAAVGLGIDPRFTLLAVSIGCQAAYMTPMGTAPMAVVYDRGGFTMKEYFVGSILPSLVWFLLFMIWFPVCMKFIF